MTIPYDYDQTNIDHLRAVIDEQEQTIKYLHERCKAEEVENAKLRELVRSAVRCITDVPDCDSCALGEQVSGVWVCHLIGAAKELGVEVDE